MTETVPRGTASGGQRTITEPKTLKDQRQIVDELAQGRWVVFAHEWLPHGISLQEWKATVTVQCRQAGVPVELVSDFRAAVTVAMNPGSKPTLELISDSVAVVQKHRRRQRGAAAD